MNHKTTTVLVAISAIAATLLAAGTVAAAIGIAGSDHPAFAHQKKGYYKGQKGEGFKGISQQSAEPQIVLCLTAGGNSPITTATDSIKSPIETAAVCTNTATATDSNTGGAIGLGYNRETGGRGQGISQQNIIPQKVICLTAGGNSPIQTACNNTATATDSNTGGAIGLGYNRETGGRGQGISQQNIIPQKVICLTAGGNSPIQTACNNRATTTDSNTGGVMGVSMR